MNSYIRLMTHNVWNNEENQPAWAAKGLDCSAEARMPSLLRIYKELFPDVIGAQEVAPHIKELMKSGLADFSCIGDGYTPIFYRTGRLTLVESDFFRYPEKRDGLDEIFNDAGSKSYSIGVFETKDGGKRFIFASTHLWWMKSPTEDMTPPYPAGYQIGSDEARTEQLLTLIRRIEEFRKKYQCPAFIVGDLNARYTAPALQAAFAAGYLHAHDVATDFADDTVGYHYCFADGYEEKYYDWPFEWAIDHILAIGTEAGAIKRFARYSPDYYLPISDHSPAYADVSL